jgi:hypothetical protein
MNEASSALLVSVPVIPRTRNFDRIETGDEVAVRITEAVAIRVEAP